MKEPRTILHVDLDAFFAAVEVRENPSLEGKPLVIGADPKGGRGRGVVSTASYEAREFGVHSAQPISTAYRLCPHAVYLPPRHSFYEQISRRFMTILRRFTDLVEPLSIDEAFLDITESKRLFGDGPAIARAIQSATEDEEQITASVGVAPVKFAAKIASDLKKPRGLVVVSAKELQEFLAPLPISRLFGCGPKAQEQLQRLGVSTLEQLRRLSLSRLQQSFGESSANHFWNLSHGQDPRPVVPSRRRKSLSKELTFAKDVADRSLVRATLLDLTEQVAAALRAEKLTGRTVTVKLRTADFHTLQRSVSSREPMDTTEALWPKVQTLLQRADKNDLTVRLIGVSLSNLEPYQASLFDDSGQRKIDQALDALRSRFGTDAVFRGTLLPGQKRSLQARKEDDRQE